MQKILHTVPLKLLWLIPFKVYAVVTTTAIGMGEATTISNHSTRCPLKTVEILRQLSNLFCVFPYSHIISLIFVH